MPQSWDMGQILSLPLRRGGFFRRPKNPTTSAGFKPANSGTSMLTTRPPKPSTEHLLWIAEQGRRNFLVLGPLCESQYNCDGSRHMLLTHSNKTAGLQFNSLHEENSMRDGYRLHTFTHVFVRVCAPYVATVLGIRVRLYDHCTQQPS